MVKKIVVPSSGQSGQLDTCSSEVDKVIAAMKGAVAGPTGSARAIIEQSNQDKPAIVSMPTESST
jgi:hypothetical protein